MQGYQDSSVNPFSHWTNKRIVILQFCGSSITSEASSSFKKLQWTSSTHTFKKSLCLSVGLSAPPVDYTVSAQMYTWMCPSVWHVTISMLYTEIFLFVNREESWLTNGWMVTSLPNLHLCIIGRSLTKLAEMCRRERFELLFLFCSVYSLPRVTGAFQSSVRK